MEHVRYPDGNVILRNLSREYPVISHGEGLYLFDTNGKRYIDASGGALVMSAGHGVREISDRIHEQLSRVAYVNGTQFTSHVAEELAARLARLSPDPSDLNRSCFLGSGSEAIEAAFKFARQLWVERGQQKRTKFIARAPSYHGNTLFALSASARPHYKKYYGPMLHELVVIPAPYEYRSQVADYAQDGGEYYAKVLEDAILREGAESIAGFIFEPIIGSSAGATLPPPGYFDRVQEICRRHGILMIADEILCGSGRTGKFFACEHYGIKPDLILLGKGLSSGYIALSSLTVRASHLNEMKSGTGYFMHAQTFLQAPSQTSAGLATLDYFEKTDAVKNAARVGEILHKLLRDEIAPLPGVGFVTGKGMLAGVEFVEDKTSKKPFDRSKKIAEGFIAHAFAQGLVLWPNVGQADGVNGDLVVFGPPLTTTEAQVREIVDALKNAITTARIFS
jgi:adenosylmethionine-8-amino-7-oxononanoate aminotransferase